MGSSHEGGASGDWGDPFGNGFDLINYGGSWIPLVENFGSKHHGYYLPSESANDLAGAMFTFPTLAAYEQYRTKAVSDPDCQAAFRYVDETNCIVRYERQFLRPVFRAG